jgi:hypothetical protein
MSDVTEIAALKAALRGARNAAGALSDVAARIETVEAETDVAGGDLDALQRLTLANAIAAEALRGLVESMLKRRGRLATTVAEEGSGGIEE